MNKLIMLLGSISISSASLLTVVSCGRTGRMNVITSEQEKITSLTSLKKSSLTENNVKLGGNISTEEIWKLVEALKLTEVIKNNPTATAMIESLRSFVMSNMLLSEIAAKVPGLGWIVQKLQWQNLNWGFNQLYDVDNEKSAFAKNASGWMENNDQWSISVTFLNEDLTGWVGINNPVYARININQKVGVNDDGTVNLENSNPDAVWPDENNKIDGSSAFLPIASSTSDQTKKRGFIYQGFVNSSELINLTDIYDPNKTTLPSGSLIYTPSATDFVNNSILQGDIVNESLKNAKDEIKKAIEKYLLNDPIFISDNMNADHIQIRIKNQIYAVLFKELLLRRKRDFKEEQLVYSNSLITMYWNSIITKAKRVRDSEYINSDDYNTINNIIEDFINKKDKDLSTDFSKDGGLSESEANTVYENLLKIIKFSKNDNDVSKTEVDFAEKNITTEMYKRNYDFSSNSFNNGNDIPLLKPENYEDFGLNGSYQFKVIYYNKPIAESDRPDFTYLSDENKTPFKDDFISDLGFKNVFTKPRFETLLKTFNKKSNMNNQTLIDDYKDSEVNVIEPFNLSEVDDNNVKNPSWFKDAGYLKQWLGDNADDSDWRIKNLLGVINKTSKERLIQIFDTSSKTHENITNYNLSASNLVFGELTNHSNPSSPINGKSNDDEAFAKLISNKSGNELPFHIVDVDKNGNSDSRDFIHEAGLENLQPFNLRLMVGTLDTYGKKVDTLDYSQWWYNDLYDLSSTKLEVWLNIYKSDSIYQAFVNYWNDNVKNNENNPDNNI